MPLVIVIVRKEHFKTSVITISLTGAYELYDDLVDCFL